MMKTTREARLLTAILIATTAGSAQLPQVKFKLPDTAGKMMTRADYPARYVLLVYQGIP